MLGTDIFIYFICGGLILFGFITIYKKEIKLDHRYGLSNKKILKGESAVVWGVIFLLLGLFLVWFWFTKPVWI